MVCSIRQHPLSGDSSRNRYNTLDFPTENRVPTGRFHPYWKPRIKGICHPFEIPARFEICIYKPEKRCLHLHIPKRKNPHSRSSNKERLWGFSNAAFIEREIFMRHTPLQRCNFRTHSLTAFSAQAHRFASRCWSIPQNCISHHHGDSRCQGTIP